MICSVCFGVVTIFLHKRDTLTCILQGYFPEGYVYNWPVPIHNVEGFLWTINRSWFGSWLVVKEAAGHNSTKNVGLFNKAHVAVTRLIYSWGLITRFIRVTSHERYGASNNRPDTPLLFTLTPQKRSKLRIIALFKGSHRWPIITHPCLTSTSL